MSPSGHKPKVVLPDSFEPQRHFYPRALNAQIHPLVRYFMGLTNERIIKRFCHLHPEVTPEAIGAVLEQEPTHFRWSGADLFVTATEEGRRQLVVIETNSSPSGQKSMPVQNDGEEQAGYAKLLRKAFLPMLKRRGLPVGGLAVLYDKNLTEASGYAATMADLTQEPVHLVPYFDGAEDPHARFTEDRVLEVRSEGEWIPIRGAFRYVTQRPWNRIPMVTRTAILNPSLVCVAGGRNKLLAAKAYDFYNAELRANRLAIRTPETIWDVALKEIPFWVQRMGGVAVIKNPYSNAGQGVYTITNAEELARFQATEHHYDRFIVQALIGNSGWTSRSAEGRLYHVGTVPDRRSHIFAADLRFMIGGGHGGFFPVAIYARRARLPLPSELEPEMNSWEVLGTNLSVKADDESWTTETDRLLLMDNRDFNRLGVGLDDLIEAYIQTVLSTIAIDRMATTLLTKKGKFRRDFFNTINPDPTLAGELWI